MLIYKIVSKHCTVSIDSNWI